MIVFHDCLCAVFCAMMCDLSKESVILIMCSANKQMCFTWALLMKRNTAWKTDENPVILKNKRYGHWKKTAHRIKFATSDRTFYFSFSEHDLFCCTEFFNCFITILRACYLGNEVQNFTFLRSVKLSFHNFNFSPSVT